MNFKTLLFQTLVVLLLMIAAESVAYFLLKNQNCHFPFFFNIGASQEIDDATRIGFNEVHPLWGWNMSEEVLRAKGFDTYHNLIVLRTGSDADSSMRIFITGGSTSDLALDPANWPAALHQMMTDKGIPHTMYVAAVGGFNSAQEYLRLIEQGIELRPHFHISYSGANETGDFGFVTEYEKDFYYKTLNRSITTNLLPNTVFFIKSKIFNQKPSLIAASLQPTHAEARFKKNLHLMNAAAIRFGYQYIGILQPLNGIGSYSFAEAQNLNTEYLGDYKKYYPAMQEFVRQNSTSFYDFTSIFDTATAQVYLDDCHLTAHYQKVVAAHVFQAMRHQTVTP